MKKISIVILLLLCFLTISPAQMVFPNDFFTRDIETDYRIIIGGSISLFFQRYGHSAESTLVQRVLSPSYERIDHYYDGDLVIQQNTYCQTIHSIKWASSRFETSRGITVGDSFDSILATYGEPTSLEKLPNGNDALIYMKRIPEINFRSELTAIQFEISNGVVVSIDVFINPLS